MLDLTGVRLAQEKAEIKVRNERAMKYSESCKKRNAEKLMNTVDRVVNTVIIIVAVVFTCLVAR